MSEPIRLSKRRIRKSSKPNGRKPPFGKILCWLILFVLIASFVRSFVRGELYTDFRELDAASSSSETAVFDRTAPEQAQKIPSADLLSNYHDTMYKRICSGLSKYRSTIYLFDLHQLDVEQIGAIFTEVLTDHPEFFWTRDVKITGIHFAFASFITLEVNSLCEPSALPTMALQMNTVTDYIVQQAEQYETDREKALYVHDYLIMNCAYDETTYDLQDTESLSYTAYGCLVDQSAVCGGYAEAYQLILNRLGIPCGVITGTAVNESGSGYHAWNYIQLGDEYYMVDTTWDDPLGYTGPYMHDYFCLTEEQMGKDHFPETGWPLEKH